MNTQEHPATAGPVELELGLLPEREGQPRTLEMRMPWVHERGHWYSPAAVREMLAAERARLIRKAEFAAEGDWTGHGPRSAAMALVALLKRA